MGGDDTFGRLRARRVPVPQRLAGTGTRVPAGRTYVRETAVRVASGEPLVSEVTDLAAQVATAGHTAAAARDRGVDRAVQLRADLRHPPGTGVQRRDRRTRAPGAAGSTTEIIDEIIAKQLGV